MRGSTKCWVGHSFLGVVGAKKRSWQVREHKQLENTLVEVAVASRPEVD